VRTELPDVARTADRRSVGRKKVVGWVPRFLEGQALSQVIDLRDRKASQTDIEVEVARKRQEAEAVASSREICPSHMETRFAPDGAWSATLSNALAP
jgi:hypothetical protein